VEIVQSYIALADPADNDAVVNSTKAEGRMVYMGFPPHSPLSRSDWLPLLCDSESLHEGEGYKHDSQQWCG